MGLMSRQVLASVVMVAALLAWWYPAPVLIRIQPVQWDRLYEARYAPSKNTFGATALARSFVQSVTKPVPLAEFIAARTKGLEVLVTDSDWAGVFAESEGMLAAGKGMRFVDPTQAPFVALDPARRYARWQDEGGIRHLEYDFVPARDFGLHDIPPEAEFPLRKHWAMLLAAGLGVGFLGFARGQGAGPVAHSSAGKGFRWSAVCAVALSAMTLWPFVYHTVGSGWSYASIVMGGFFLLGPLLAMWLFGRQIFALRRMIGGEYLAHFTYEAEEWERFAQWNFGEEKADKSALWVLIFVITLVIGLGFMAVMRDEASVWVFAYLMGLMAVLWILAVGLPRLTRRRDLRQPGEVYVAETSVYLNGSVHTWNYWGARLESVEFRKKPLPHVLLVYSYLMVAGRSLYFFRNRVPVRIPVPGKQLSVAHELVKGLENQRIAG